MARSSGLCWARHNLSIFSGGCISFIAYKKPASLADAYILVSRPSVAIPATDIYLGPADSARRKGL